MTASRPEAKDVAEREGHAVTPRPLLFDPWLTSDHLFVRTVVDNLAFRYEHLLRPRQRAMKERDRKELRAILVAVFANLARAAVQGDAPPTIAIRLQSAKGPLTRYDRRRVPGDDASLSFSGLSEVVKTLASERVGFTLHKSSSRRTPSTIVADDALAGTLGRFKFRPEDVEQAPGGETIWLSLAHGDGDYGADETASPHELVHYEEDTSQSVTFRREMATINAALRGADMAMAHDGRRPVLTGLRELRRSFILPPGDPASAPRFDLGGRLIGGWWQSLPPHRLPGIRLDGEAQLAHVRFDAMLLRLAYLEASERPPEGSDLAGMVPGLPDPRWRDGLRKATNAMLLRSAPMLRLPKDAKAALPPRLPCAQVRAAIIAAHPALTAVFEAGMGPRLIFLESQILVAALLRMIGQGVTAVLPMHDGVICPASKAAAVQNAMRDAAEEVAGFRLPAEARPIGK